MRRYSIYILVILLTFLVGSVTPALWEVSDYYAKKWRMSRRPINMNHDQMDRSKRLELLDLAVPLPPNSHTDALKRKPQSNNGMQRTRN
jgi:hypothetical protein